MKIITIGILLLIFIIMLIITLNIFLPESDFLFARISNTSMMSISKPALIYPTLFLLIYSFFIFLFIIKFKKVFVLIALVFLVLWIFSGRTFGIMVVPDCRISTGWFNIETTRYSLSDPKVDCETIVYNYTSIEKLDFWSIRIKNEKLNEVIFIGPFIWQRTIEILDGLTLKNLNKHE